MPILEINGRRVEVDNSFLKLRPEQQQATVEEIARSFAPEPRQAELGPMQGPQQPIAEGDWSGLNDRLSQAAIEIAPGTMGPVSPDQMAKQRLEAAQMQGQIYGQSRPAAETAFRTGVDVAGLGAGNFMEALTSGLGSGMSFPERHEFIKAADAGRAMQSPTAAGIGTGAGIVAQALAVPGGAAPTSVRQAMTQGSILGAGTAGAQEAINSRGDIEQIVPAAVGGWAGGGIGGAGSYGLSKLVGSGVNKVGQMVAGKPVVPTKEALREAADAAYARADAAGVIVGPGAMQRTVQGIQDDLTKYGFLPRVQPNVAAVLDEISSQAQGNVTLKGVDVLRQMADAAAKSPIPKEAAMGTSIINRLDEMVEGLSPQDVVMGDAQAGSAALKEARNLWSRFRKSEAVDEALERAANRASGAGGGGNIDNATRQQMRPLLEKGRGFTSDEKEALKTIIRGGAGQNTLRLIGKAAPTGIVSGGMGTSLGAGLGSMVGGPGGAAAGALAVPAVGQVAKLLADRATAKNVEALSNIIRAGGKEAAEGVRLLDKLPKGARDAVVRALVNSGSLAGGMGGAAAGPAVYGAFGGQ